MDNVYVNDGDYLFWHYVYSNRLRKGELLNPMLGRLKQRTQNVDIIIDGARRLCLVKETGSEGWIGTGATTHKRYDCEVINQWHPLYSHAQAIRLAAEFGAEFDAVETIVSTMIALCSRYGPHNWRHYRPEEEVHG